MTDTPNTHETLLGYKLEPFATGKGMYLWKEDKLLASFTLDEMKVMAGWMESLIQAAEREGKQ